MLSSFAPARHLSIYSDIRHGSGRRFPLAGVIYPGPLSDPVFIRPAFLPRAGMTSGPAVFPDRFRIGSGRRDPARIAARRGRSRPARAFFVWRGPLFARCGRAHINVAGLSIYMCAVYPMRARVRRADAAGDT